jgi:lysophospholipase L1-like esterase
MTPRSATSQSITTTKKVVFSLITLILVSLCLELSWRTYLFYTGHGFFDDPREFISPFFTTYDEPMPYLTHDGFEFRYSTVPREKQPNEIRIIAFGGSTTVNWRAGISYTTLLTQELARDYDNYQVHVLNAGGDAYSTAHTLVNFCLRNIDVQPDIIIIYHNVNDLSVRSFGTSTTSDYSNKYKGDFYLGFRHRTGILAEVMKVSRLARFVLFKFDAIRFPAEQHTQTRDYAPGLEYFRRNLRSTIAIAKANNIRVVLASQAAAANVRGRAGFKAYNEAVQALAKEENVPFVNVAGSLTDDDSFLNDSVHYTRAGVERLAETFHGPVKGIIDQMIRPHVH